MKVSAFEILYQSFAVYLYLSERLIIYYNSSEALEMSENSPTGIGRIYIRTSTVLCQSVFSSKA